MMVSLDTASCKHHLDGTAGFLNVREADHSAATALPAGWPVRAAHTSYDSGPPIHADKTEQLITVHRRSKTSPRDGCGVVRDGMVASHRREKPAQFQDAR